MRLDSIQGKSETGDSGIASPETPITHNNSNHIPLDTDLIAGSTGANASFIEKPAIAKRQS